MKLDFISSVVIIIMVFLTSSCSPMVIQTAPPDPGLHVDEPQIANPASEYCLHQGGNLKIEQRGDGGEFGICIFEENRQCEEWALMRGGCPVGGIKITGYLTDAGRYCAITGGEYAVTTNSKQEDEGGTCTFKNGKVCDVWEYFNGECDDVVAQETEPQETPQSSTDTDAYAQSEETAPESAAQILFSSNRSGDYYNLYLIDLDGVNLVQLTDGDNTKFAGPFSPDGAQIVYTSFGLTTSDIYLMDADGINQRDLTAGSDSDEGFPSWSPDGSQIAFTSRRDGNNEIYLMGVDGSNPTRITDSPGDDFAPSWSPDGTQIVFVSDRDRDPGIYDIYIMNADGSGVTRLTDDDAIDYRPDWSPDGTQIIYRSHHDGGSADIYSVDVDGGAIENLTNTPDDEWAPKWSPDGSQIAFQTNRDGNWEIYIMNADGGQQTNLTNDPADDQLPYWRPEKTQGESETDSQDWDTGEKVPLEQAMEVFTQTIIDYIAACKEIGIDGFFFATTQWGTFNRLSK
jgi:Tol biopolymer transport system component/putative hemolysin